MRQIKPNYIKHLSHQGSQVALIAKNLPDSAGDVRDPGSTLGQEDSPEEDTATDSNSILAWRSPVDGGAFASYSP